MVEISATADRLIKQKIWLTLESTHRTSETRLNFFYGPRFTHVYQTIEQLWDEHDKPIERVNRAMMTVKMKVKYPVKRFDRMRKLK